jgi:hypothetical protein
VTARHPPQHPDRSVRREQALRRLGTRNPHCQCGETNPHALTGQEPNVICFNCKAVREGRAPYEDDHVAGWHNDPTTVRLSINDHRVKSDMERDRPDKTLRNPEGSPAIACAARVRGVMDHLQLLIDRFLAPVAHFLEWLDDALTVVLGPRWWETLSWQGNPS